MSKIYGLRKDFAPVREDRSRTIVSYGLQVEPDGEHATWDEVYFYKKKVGRPSKEQIKDAIVADINAKTDEKILNGYEWTVLHGDDAGRTVKVWLSDENKENYKAKFDMAHDDPELITWPVKFKISENDDKNPIYEHFENVSELKAFYYGGLNHIEQAVNSGWAEKDGMDWTPYE